MGELAVWTFSLRIQCHAALATFMSQGVAEAQPQLRLAHMRGHRSRISDHAPDVSAIPRMLQRN